MGNKVCKACGTVSGRKHRQLQEEVPEQHTRRSESLEWLNDLVGRLWPKIDAAVQKIVYEQVTPQLQESLPGPFKGTHFKKFTLGSKTPRFGPIEVLQREDGLKLILNIDYQSDVDVEISAVVASVGIKSISLRGQLMIRLGPLIDEMPVVGGMVAYFNDQPDLDLEFTGVGSVADMPMIKTMIHKQINNSINSAMVLPNCISVPLATPEQGVDPALLKKPKPLAMLRARALRGKDLAARDWNITTKASSDPFVRITVANDTWSSSVVKQDLNPTWTAQDVHDFVVFDQDQHLQLEVLDEDMMSGADFIGAAKPVRVANLQAISEKPMDLLDQSDKPAGSVEMKFEWLKLTQKLDKTAGMVVMVEVKELVAREALLVAMQLLSQEKKTALVAPKASPPEASQEQQLRCEVARRCKAQGLLEEDAIATISGLTLDEVKNLDETVSPKAASPKAEEEKAEVEEKAKEKTQEERPLEFHSAWYFSVPAEGLEKEELTLTALDGKEKACAKASVKLSELLEKGAMRLEKMQGEGGEIAAKIKVCIYGLQR